MKKQIIELSPVALAFLGDGVHTLFVREYVLSDHDYTLKNYNKICSKFCSAIWQSKVLDKLKISLDEEEQNVVRRARNSKTNNIAKSASLEEYKKATSFEALVGWLYLNKKTERLNQILEFSIKMENK